MAEETITVSCAGDSQLAAEIYNHLCSKVGKADTGYISLVEDEIGIDRRSTLTKDAVRQILDSFVRSNPERLKNHQVIESGDIFVVGIVAEPSKVDALLTCEFCGYFTPYQEDLFIHKRMHAGGGG